MLQFILRRLGLVIPTFIGITLLTFAFVHMIPGDPVMIMAGERGSPLSVNAQLLAELGLDKPMWQQYLHYIWGVMHGDLGISMKSRIPVWEEFVPRFQATLELGVCAMILLRQSVFRLVCWLRLNAVPFSITQRLARR